jgi:translation initiation factor 3 subunit C
MYYISAMFDTVKMIDAYMSIDMWLECHRALTRVLEVLDANQNLKLGPMLIDDLATQAMKNQGMNKGNESAMLSAAAKSLEDDDGESKDTGEGEEVRDITRDENDPNMVRVPGDLSTYLQRLSTDFTKSLQQTDPNTSEYVERLNNEGLFLTLATAVQKYYMRHHAVESKGKDVPTEYSMNASRMAVKRISHMYYKTDSISAKLECHQANVALFGHTKDHHPSCKGKSPREGGALLKRDISCCHPGSWLGAAKIKKFVPSNVKETMDELCRFVFSNLSGASKEDMARAQLCQVYYHALHDRYHQARDLMLMSKLEPTGYDIQIQILYNRTVAQIGLCAFRVGLYNNSKDCLSEICGRNKQKELLAQGVSYFHARGKDRDVEAERAERRRQVP